MEIKRFLLIVFFLFLIIPTIDAQSPFQQPKSFSEGFEIKIPAQGIIKQNEDFIFHFHVFNISNGLPVTEDEGVNCFFHLYNESGNHILKENITYEPSNILNEWDIKVTGGNFSRVSMMNYIIQCNTDEFGGFESVGFDVTPTGFIIETSEANIYIVVLIATFILFLALLFPAIKLPYSNKTDNEGAVVSITKAKYLKLLSIWFAYGFLMWFLQTLNSITSAFLKLTHLSNFITNIFTYSNWFSVGITFLVLAIIFIEVWKDIILSNTIKKFGKAFTDGRLQ